MFIKKISIQNYRIFSNENIFKIDDINIPDEHNEGSGLTMFVGENGCGKTSLLDAIALPLLSYKSEGFSLNDFSDPSTKTFINIFSEKDFSFKGTLPGQTYKAKGFAFEAGIRSKENKLYLSSIVVSDQKYIKAEGESKPKDGTPDLRVAVNNPWSGARFNENEILFLDRDRIYQTRSGTYRQTKFDRLMEDLDFQYIKQDNSPFNFNERFKDISDTLQSDFLKNAFEKFKEISNQQIELSFIDNWRPYFKAFFGLIKNNKQYVSLNNLGSGYEMIFCLIYSFYLAQQSGKKLIILIDEPELHLHPLLQQQLVKILLEFSKTAQIVLTTHSPLFVKQMLFNDKIKSYILKRENEDPKISLIQERVLSYVSANEINFIAFNLATEEYHTELYGYLEAEKEYLFKENINKHNTEECMKYWNNKTQVYEYVSLHKYIRHQIHHPDNTLNIKFTEQQLIESIHYMRGLLLK